MISPQRPVGQPVYQPAPYAAQNTGVVPYAAPQAPVPYIAGQPVQGQSKGIMEVAKDIVTGIINFFKKLFSGGNAATTPVNPTLPTTPTSPTNPTASLDDATLAAQYGLLNNPANIAAFRDILARTTAEPGVIGPGSTNRDAVLELQQVLGQFGFPVQVTGTFDAATADALMNFKVRNGVTENFQFANGQAGTTPFVDTRTKAAMIALLTGQTAPTTPGSVSTNPTTPGPVVVAPPPPLAPAPPPVAPPPPPPPPPPPIAPAPAPTLPTTIPTTPAAQGLTAEETQVAAQAGILATKENLAKFMVAAQAIEAAADVIGPGLRDSKETVDELQQVLMQFGYNVTKTGTFDQATVAAVLKFKKDSNVTYDYQMNDGSAGIHPFIDQRTKDAMIKKLNGQ